MQNLKKKKASKALFEKLYGRQCQRLDAKVLNHLNHLFDLNENKSYRNSSNKNKMVFPWNITVHPCHYYGNSHFQVFLSISIYCQLYSKIFFR